MRRHLLTGAAFVAAFGLLAACAGPGPGPSPDLPDDRPLRAQPEQIGDDLWMIPVARDSSGCLQYRLHSDNRATLQAIFYRTPIGAYSTNRAEAGCS